MGFVDTALRVGGAVMTAGVSEAVRAGYNAVKPRDMSLPEGLYGGATDYGAGTTEPNPDYAAWAQKMAALQARLAKARTFGQDTAAIQQEIAAHNSAKPPETRATALGQQVQRLDAAGAQAAQNMAQSNQQLQQSAANAAQQGQQVNAQAQQQALGASQREAPQMAESQTTLQQQQAAIDNLNRFVPTQQGASDLRAFARGPAGPSAAEAMLRLQAARDRAAAISRARSARGGPGAVAEAMKIAQAEGAGIAADTRGQMAIVQADEAAKRRSEQLTALTSAGQQELDASQQTLDAKKAIIEATSRVRDQDVNVLRSNLDSRLQTMGLNDSQVQFFTGLGEAARQNGQQALLTAQAQGIDANIALANVNAQYADMAWRMLSNDQQVQLQKLGMEMGVDMANAEQRSAFVGQVLGFVGMGVSAGAAAMGKPPAAAAAAAKPAAAPAGAAASDRRVKRDIEKVKSMAAALRSTAGHSWNYKDPDKHGKGRYTGPMAQDLEKRPEFRSAVKEVNGVKMVDATRLVMTHHAALHDLQKQIDRIAKRREKNA